MGDGFSTEITALVFANLSLGSCSDPEGWQGSCPGLGNQGRKTLASPMLQLILWGTAQMGHTPRETGIPSKPQVPLVASELLEGLGGDSTTSWARGPVVPTSPLRTPRLRGSQQAPDPAGAGLVSGPHSPRSSQGPHSVPPWALLHPTPPEPFAQDTSGRGMSVLLKPPSLSWLLPWQQSAADLCAGKKGDPPNSAPLLTVPPPPCHRAV